MSSATTTRAHAPHLVYLATDPLTAFRLMDGQLAAMRERGFRVTVITAPGELLERVAERERVAVYGVPMRRDIAPREDVVSLWKLVRLLRELRPDLVNAGTPKAGLLGTIAARLAKVPVVVYLLRGLRFEGASGARRLVLAAVEHVSGSCAHRVFCNSDSLRERYVALGCAAREKTFVPANGTSNGVDVARFTPTEEVRAWCRGERQRLGIPGDAFVVGFVGRLARDKGIAELAEAFEVLSARLPEVRLLLVGGADETDPLPARLAQRLATADRIHVTGFVREPSAYYAMMDVFAFPSYREGFPNAPLEAAAASVPTVAFRATGTVDAVLDGVTGYLVPAKDPRALAEALLRYAEDRALREQHGRAARERVASSFSREIVWDALAAEYERLLGRRALSTSAG